MRILVVSTNPDFVEKDTGTTASRNKLIYLLSQKNEVYAFNAVRNLKLYSSTFQSGDGRTYYFKQGFLFGKCLMLFTDFNFSFISKLRKIVKREKIDLICITEPYGIISSSIICKDTPVIYDAHDVVSEHARIGFQRLQLDFKIARVPVIKSIIRFSLINYIYLIERLACRRSKHILAITELDRQKFINNYNADKNKITTIPVWTDIREVILKEDDIHKNEVLKVVFHGIYGHPANYEAFQLIEKFIAPKIWEHNKNIQFVLAGTGVPKYEKENIKSLGYVEDLFSLFRKCSIGIVPILHGTGVRMKILDYMSAGLPVISTQSGISGIDAENGKHAIILEDVNDDFIYALLHLANDKALRQKLVKNSIDLIQNNYNRNVIQIKLESALSGITVPPQSIQA